MTTYLAYVTAYDADSAASDSLYRAYIFFANLANSGFMGLLLLLASGYCITRQDTGSHKAQVVGIPSVLFVTGLVTDYIYFGVASSPEDDTAITEMSGWESGLWLVCTLLNVGALMLAWVSTFDILQQEVEYITAQEQANRPKAGNTVGADERGANGSAENGAHAAPVSEFDQALAAEGVTAYRNLLGPNQNISHIPGADTGAQEFETVADRLNFEVKKTMLTRFSLGIGFYLVATICVLLLPIFINSVVQGVIVFAHFMVQLAFLAILAWLFRPTKDSAYLMLGGSLEEAEEMGMVDLHTGLDVHDAQEDFQGSAGGAPLAAQAPQGGGGKSAPGSASAGSPGADGRQRDQGGSVVLRVWDRGAGDIVAAHMDEMLPAPVREVHGAPSTLQARFSLNGDDDAELAHAVADPSSAASVQRAGASQPPRSAPALAAPVPATSDDGGTEEGGRGTPQRPAPVHLTTFESVDLQEVSLTSPPARPPKTHQH